MYRRGVVGHTVKQQFLITMAVGGFTPHAVVGASDVLTGRGIPPAVVWWGGVYPPVVVVMLALGRKLWQKAVAPIYYHARSLRPTGRQAGRMAGHPTVNLARPPKIHKIH